MAPRTSSTRSPGHGVRDVVAAAFEAEEPVTSDHARGPLHDEIRGRWQRQQRRVIARRADGDDLAVRAVHPLARDLLVPGQPADVRLLITGESCGRATAARGPSTRRARPCPSSWRGRPGRGASRTRSGARRRALRDERSAPRSSRPCRRAGAPPSWCGHTAARATPAEVRERRAVTRPERDEILRAGQPAERVTGVTEHHVEAVQRQLQPRAGPDRLLMRPVDLRLKPRPGLEPRLATRRRPRPRTLDIPTDRVIAALKPVVADQVLMNPGRQRPRLRRQPLIDQRLERVKLRSHPLAVVHRLRALLEIPLHRPPIPPQQPADLRIRVTLTRQRPDIHQILLADHRRPPARRHQSRERQDRLRQDSQQGPVRRRARA
jgi:hypothetical protein